MRVCRADDLICLYSFSIVYGSAGRRCDRAPPLGRAPIARRNRAMQMFPDLQNTIDAIDRAIADEQQSGRAVA